MFLKKYKTKFIELLETLYNNNDLKNLKKELKNYSFYFTYDDISFIDIKDKKYKIFNNNNEKYTLYEYCVLSKKFRYVKQLCHQIIKYASIYTTDKYFEYCKMGNVGAVHFCILEGINPQTALDSFENKNAFVYACERGYNNMLSMLLENF